MGWVDLNRLRETESNLAFVSLFDDTEGVWRDEDLRLLSTVPYAVGRDDSCLAIV